MSPRKRGTEDGGQRTEDRGQKTENGEQMTECRIGKLDNQGKKVQEPEDRTQKLVPSAVEGTGDRIQDTRKWCEISHPTLCQTWAYVNLDWFWENTEMVRGLARYPLHKMFSEMDLRRFTLVLGLFDNFNSFQILRFIFWNSNPLLCNHRFCEFTAGPCHHWPRITNAIKLAILVMRTLG